ncbi:hypothetical protein E1B28_004593 [Marasmius oreades]|uniref:DUF1742-domain-containing protein n=1 Tax=Marasmius oreades TaxID=181124 RepID=A0A9P7UYY9_9AGAR|nr:uncharacterized protein E1B28_004593 [Marasmius oreades]KAG7097222.1 hypothetical protein E1B28_004593 [Marasmius oreades]
MSSTFPNLYYKRLAGTPRACYVCDKPTTTVLATINTVDFIYTCPTHLADRNFASRIVDSAPAKPKASDEEIQKVKREWEEKQKKKQEKEKEKEEAEKDQKTDEKDDKKESKVKPPSPASAPASTPPSTTHERYSLHRDFFSMRLAEHRKKRQTVQAKELGPRLPGAPTGTIVGS